MSIKPNGDTREAVNELAQSHLFLTHNQQAKKVSKLSQGGGGISYSFLVSVLCTGTPLWPSVVVESLEPFPTQYTKIFYNKKCGP